MDSYDILDVSKEATEEEIDKAYKSKIKESHPDLGGSKSEFIKVNNAYENIKSKENNIINEKSIREKILEYLNLIIIH